MRLESWLAITSVALFAMFAGEMISVYVFMINVGDDSEFEGVFSANAANSKIFQFISIGVGPAGILAAIAFIMSKRYGSKQIGGLIIVGGIILLVGMVVCYSLLSEIEKVYLTDAVKYIPILFMVLSVPVFGFGIYLIKNLKPRPKKEYF